MRRATTFGGMLLYLLGAFVSGIVILGVGYWLSDAAYAHDLWPIGAVMRVGLLLFLVGWIIGLVSLGLATLASPFMGDDS
jgi:hypothetical protein